jgi:hypothetical protein
MARTLVEHSASGNVVWAPTGARKSKDKIQMSKEKQKPEIQKLVGAAPSCLLRFVFH